MGILMDRALYDPFGYINKETIVPASDESAYNTFAHMLEIIDTNHLTHELTEADLEIIDLLSPDIRTPSVEAALHNYKPEKTK